ncbi:hypothetical protein JDV02_010679 [Purpureocillium takamizusanense]|uniref:2EXR domain-containing protein n=1 Tax=Purpureocillium takamizusanense TaxID=2060973 RepID=A0A9Q8VGU1_9HYPO|nr:uncharacterized protein JDV02_010679 [Purpureocillium takamizusanense]UNI24966.1 hypothetical protein JDV02_010679 [Purpureocillium takamizusanense]
MSPGPKERLRGGDVEDEEEDEHRTSIMDQHHHHDPSSSSDFRDPESPTLNEVLRKYKRAACSGKQCPHPANVWFRDARREPERGGQRQGQGQQQHHPHQRRKSNNNTIVLRELITELAPDVPTAWSVVERCDEEGCKDDGDSPKEENEPSSSSSSSPSTFPQFHRLPAELQELIWRAAVPRRWVHYALPSSGGFAPDGGAGMRYPPLPVPQVASVCRAARHVVLGGGANVLFRRDRPAGTPTTEEEEGEGPANNMDNPTITSPSPSPSSSIAGSTATRQYGDVAAGFIHEHDLLYVTQEPQPQPQPQPQQHHHHHHHHHYHHHNPGPGGRGGGNGGSGNSSSNTERQPAAAAAPMMQDGHGGVTTATWTADKALGVIQTAESIAVCWQDPCSLFLGPNSPNDRFGHRQLARWSFLKGCAALRTLFVNFRDQPVTLQVPVRASRHHHHLTTSPPPPASSSPPPSHLIPRDSSTSTSWTDALNLVRLYDDDRLAQLTRLETSPTRTSLPRYHYDAGRRTRRSRDGNGGNGGSGGGGTTTHPGRCLNCERVQWERHHRPAVERFWLQLWADGELGEAEREAAFPSRTTYDASHPWVRDKMERAPEFVPVVAVRIEIQTE